MEVVSLSLSTLSSEVGLTLGIEVRIRDNDWRVILIHIEGGQQSHRKRWDLKDRVLAEMTEAQIQGPRQRTHLEGRKKTEPEVSLYCSYMLSHFIFTL